MKNRIWVSGAMAALMMVGCSQQVDVPDAETPSVVVDATYDAFMAVANERLTVSDAAEADLTDLAAALPEIAALRWDSKSFDATSGATVFEGLSLGISTDPEFGVRFDEAKVWGLDTDLLTARLTGERLEESGLIFSRLEGTNMSYYGLPQVLNAVFEQMLAGVEEELPEGTELAFNELSSVSERVVLTGVSLRPWELTPLSPEALSWIDEDIPPEVLNYIHLGQQFIAISRSIAVETNIAFGTAGAIELLQPGAELTAEYEIGFIGVQNTRGFDFESYVVRDYSGSQVNAYSAAAMPGDVVTLSGFPAGFSLAQKESYSSATISDVRLDKLMGFFARSELPSLDEQDLISFGRWSASDYRAELNDREILTAERTYFNADQFEWFIPSDLSFGMEGATLNTGELTGFFQVLFETFLDAAAPEEMNEQDQAEIDLVREGLQNAIDLLPEHGLDTLPFDAKFNLSWDPETGPTDLNLLFDADGYGKSAFDIGITLPGYAAVQAAYESEDREAAFEEAFMNAFAFRGARLLEEDKGGYAKLFGFAHDLGKQYPQEVWGSMLANLEPEQMRAYLGTMMRMGKTAAAEEFPPAADWIEAYASYLEAGGTIEFASNPPEPITAAFIEAQNNEDPDPDMIVEILGLTVTHTK
nr:hypothetical protein [Hyphomonas sp. Mor2]